jgi:uncharacterized membrane protein
MYKKQLVSLIKTFKMIFIQNIFYFLSLIFGGLIAGLLFSYSCSVNIGLKSLTDIEYIKAMQAINLAIQNPYFFISFIGLLFVLPISSYLMYKQQENISFYLLILATIIYFIAVFGTTLFCNVPLNEQLARFSISASTANEIAVMRQSFEKSWTMYHSVRTIASILSFSFTILSIFKSKC